MTLNFDKQVKDRNEFDLRTFQSEIQNSIYHNKEENDKGLYHASIIDSYLIDYYVPFLPLEREHVKNCIRAEIKIYNVTHRISKTNYVINEYDVDQIADEHVYEPPGYKKYSSSGCKRVPFLVRTFISKKNFKPIDEF